MNGAEKIGLLIKSRREELKLSQEEVAKRMGYESESSRSVVHKMEKGLYKFKVPTIKKLSEALEVSPKYFWDYDVEKSAKEDAEMLKIYTQLNDTDRQAVLILAKTLLSNYSK